LTKTVEMEFDYENVPIRFVGEWEPRGGGHYYAKNGDPGDPPEGGCFDEFLIFVGEGEVSALFSEEAIDGIYQMAVDRMDAE